MMLSLAVDFLAVFPAHADQVDDYIRAQMQEHRIPGVALTIIQNGAVTKTATYGLADLEQNVPVSTNSVFEIGSITKQFTAAGLLLLQQKGRLSVDDKTLHFRPVQNDQGEVLTVSPGDGLLEFRPRLSTLGQITELKVRGWSPKDKKELEGKAASGDEVSTMGGQDSGSALANTAFKDAPGLVGSLPVRTQAEADQLAKAGFNRWVLALVVGEGVCIGRTDLHPGTVIKLDGLGDRFSGKYYVKSTSHCYTPHAAYRTHFVVWRNAS
jgi:hypothetical protein